MPRYRSPATMPGYNKGRAPGNKGRKMPRHVLTPDEFRALLDQFSTTAATKQRNRAMVSVMYRAGAKAGEVTAMDTRHYRRGARTITLPGGITREERERGVGADLRRELDGWLDYRDQYDFGPLVPLFCGLGGRPVAGSYLRAMLKREARRAGITKTVTPETLRRSYLYDQAAVLPERIHAHVEAYIEGEWFRS